MLAESLLVGGAIPHPDHSKDAPQTVWTLFCCRRDKAESRYHVWNLSRPRSSNIVGQHCCGIQWRILQFINIHLLDEDETLTPTFDGWTLHLVF